MFYPHKRWGESLPSPLALFYLLRFLRGNSLLSNPMETLAMQATNSYPVHAHGIMLLNINRHLEVSYTEIKIFKNI